MKRWIQLTELRHSLTRARVFAEEANHPAIAQFITNSLVGIQSEIESIEAAKKQPAPAAKPSAKRVVKSRTNKEESTPCES